MKSVKSAAVLLLIAVTTATVFGVQETKKGVQETKKGAPNPPMDQKAAMAMMEKLATPGEGHKKLDFMVGSWVAKNSMWMAPGQAPMVSEGTSEHKWVLGGRFLEQRYEGTFMNMPFSGIAFTGFDNYKKQYTSTWMDTSGTSTLITTGTFDASGKILTTTGKMDDFTTGKTATVREKMTMVSKDEILFEVFGPGPDGKDYRMMEIRYTRKK
jgi:hypothetical protein